MPFDKPDQTPEGATRVQGRPATNTELNKKLKMARNPDFFLMHHPNGWALEETSEGYELLPVLKDLVLAGGINRVELTENGPNSQAARTKLKDESWVVLEEQNDYRVVVDVSGGIAHRLKWDIIDRYPDGTFDLRFDHQGWHDYRRSLVEDGVVKPPRASVVQVLERRLERRIGRRAAKLHIPGVVVVQNRDELALQGLQEAKAAPKARKPKAAKKAASDKAPETT